MQSSIVFFSDPPVDMFTTAPVDCLIRGRKAAKSSGLIEIPPSAGRRACRCRLAAPVSAAAIAWAAISSGVQGSASDMVGVWITPVTAQVMMIFWRFAMAQSSDRMR